MVVNRRATDDLQRVLEEQNPWWSDGQVPRTLAPSVKRPLAALLWLRLQDPSLPQRYELILGPRRVGKTTVLYQTVEQLLSSGVPRRRICWMRLDHPRLIEEELGRLVRLAISTSGATDEHPLYLMLDELAYSQRWDLWLKTFYDERWPVRIAATSSATAALRERRLESGVGRWEEQYLMPILLPEFLDLTDDHHRLPTEPTLAATIQAMAAGDRADRVVAERRRELLLVGGYPELLARARTSEGDERGLLLESQRVLREDAVERAIYKDIPQSFGVDNPLMLERLLYVLAAQVTGVLSPAAIRKDLGLPQATFDRYLTYLEWAFLVFTAPNYSGNESAVQRRGRKLYFVDGAVCNAALQRGVGAIDDPTDGGRLLENLVVSSLRSMSLQVGTRIYHWREGKHEVDVVVDHPEEPMAFEVGSSSRHSRAGLRAFMERYPRFRDRCYVVAPDSGVLHPENTESGVGVLPLDLLLVAAGALSEDGLTRRMATAGGMTTPVP